MIWKQNTRWHIIGPGVAMDNTENGVKFTRYIKKDLEESGMDMIHPLDTPLDN